MGRGLEMTSKRLPWSRASGLLAGCMATLIGICSRLEPDTILMRSVVAAVIVAVFVRVVRAIAYITVPRRHTR